MPALYFLGNRLLDQSPTLPWWASDSPWTASQALFCPKCGEVWARIVIPGEQWTAVIRNCEKCGDGQILPPWSVPLNTYPPRVIEREAKLLLEKVE